MNVRRIRFDAVGVGVGVAVELYDGGTSPPAERPPFGPGSSGDADAEPGVSSGVAPSGAVLSGAAHALKPATSEAPNTPKTARRAGLEAGVEMGTGEWSPHM